MACWLDLPIDFLDAVFEPGKAEKEKGKGVVAAGDATVDEDCYRVGDMIYKVDVPASMMKLCYSTLGWLVIQSEDLKLALYHPVKHSKIHLPDGGTMSPPPRFYYHQVSKFCLSATPTRKDCILMCHSNHRLAFCRPGLGERSWTNMALSKPTKYIVDLTYYKGHFYVVDIRGRVSVLDYDFEHGRHRHCHRPGHYPVQQLREVSPELPTELLMRTKQLHLVESAGALLLVLCYCEGFRQTAGCRVFDISAFSNGSSRVVEDWEVKSLGKRSLFLSLWNSSFSVEASDYSGCKPSCIYFMNNYSVSPLLDLDMGIFNMEDGSLDRDSCRSFSTGFQQVRTSFSWIEPSSNIFINQKGHS